MSQNNQNTNNPNYNRQQTPTKHHSKEHYSRLKQYPKKQKSVITPDSFENEIKRELTEVNDLQKGLLDDLIKTSEEIKQMRENNEEKSKEIKRNVIVPNEYNEYTTVMETETERYLTAFKTTLEQRFNELSVIEEITTSIKIIDKDEINKRINSIEQTIPHIEEETKEKQQILKTLEEYQSVISGTLEKLNKQSQEEMKQQEQNISSEHRSYAADIETILYLENGDLLLSYLQTISIDKFCEIQFSQPVLLSLISNIVSNLSTEYIEVRLSFLLLSLKLLKQSNVNHRYIELFQNIQKTFISFSMLIHHENCYKSILTILFMCEDIIRTLETQKKEELNPK